MLGAVVVVVADVDAVVVVVDVDVVVLDEVVDVDVEGVDEVVDELVGAERAPRSDPFELHAAIRTEITSSSAPMCIARIVSDPVWCIREAMRATLRDRSGTTRAVGLPGSPAGGVGRRT